MTRMKRNAVLLAGTVLTLVLSAGLAHAGTEEGNRGEDAHVIGQPRVLEQIAEVEQEVRAVQLYNRGAARFNNGDLDGAVAPLEESLAENPEFVEAHLALAWIHLGRDDPARAYPHAEKANELLPENDTIQRLLFDALWGLGQYDRALPMLDAMAASGKAAVQVAQRSYNAAVRDVHSGDLSEARRHFEQALALDPNLVAAHRPLGEIKLGEGEHEAARRHALIYTEAKPDDTQGLTLLYSVLVKVGDEAAAAAVLERIERVNPGQSVRLLIARATVNFNEGDFAGAQSALEMALRLQPDHPQSHYLLGMVCVSSGDIPQAKEYLTRFLELAPDDPEAESVREILRSI